MNKTAALNVRVDPEVKQSAESVLGKLGISMSTAVDNVFAASFAEGWDSISRGVAGGAACGGWHCYEQR